MKCPICGEEMQEFETVVTDKKTGAVISRGSSFICEKCRITVQKFGE